MTKPSIELNKWPSQIMETVRKISPGKENDGWTFIRGLFIRDPLCAYATAVRSQANGMSYYGTFIFVPFVATNGEGWLLDVGPGAGRHSCPTMPSDERATVERAIDRGERRAQLDEQADADRVG